MRDRQGAEFRGNAEDAMAPINSELAADETDAVVAVPLSFEEYEETEERRKRTQSRILWSVVALATIGLPIAYLQITGQFSANSLRHETAARRAPARDSAPVYNPIAEPKRSPAEQLRFDRLKTDLSDYVMHDLPSLAPQEKVAVFAFTNATGSNFKNEATTMHALRRDVIPAQERLVAAASALHPKTEEIRTLNSLLVLSAKMRLVAYRQMLSGQNDPDGLWKYAFDAEFKDSDEKAQEFHSQLTRMTNETAIRLPR